MASSGARPAGGGGGAGTGGGRNSGGFGLDGDRLGESRAGTVRAVHRGGRTAAQWFCLLGGLALLLAGLLGFLADATFDTSASVDTDAGGNANGQLQGDSFLGFEVNGWHNLVHVASGLLLLSGFARRSLAKTVAIVFGLTYGLVTLIGLIDGNDMLGILPVNPADNILHSALTALGLGTGLVSPGNDTDRRGHMSSRFEAPSTRGSERVRS